MRAGAERTAAPNPAKDGTSLLADNSFRGRQSKVIVVESLQYLGTSCTSAHRLFVSQYTGHQPACTRAPPEPSDPTLDIISSSEVSEPGIPIATWYTL